MVRLTRLPRALPLLALLSIAAPFAAGCDPEAPGASGTLTLGAAVDAASFQTLAIRTFANESGPWDPSMVIPADADKADEAVSAVKFPHPYRVGGEVGSSPVGDWQLVAWLSHRSEVDLRQAASLDPGDAFCTVAYHPTACSLGTRGYCGVVAGVNCQLAPASP